MDRFAIAAIGRDRPGIVAAVTEALLNFRGNIEDSQMSILGGHFSMTLIVSLEAKPAVESELRRSLEEVQQRLDLEAMSVSAVEDYADSAPKASHILSVYGADHPGIVYAVSRALAEREISITNLETKLSRGDRPLYVMLIEISAGAADVGELGGALEALGSDAGLEISLRELDDTAL